MTKFIHGLQILFAVIFAVMVGYDFILQGITIFEQKYVLLSGAFWLLLELALLVIYKLVADD